MQKKVNSADRIVLPKKRRKTKSAANDNGFTFIDLFAGIGGFRIGFEAIGGTCVFTCEKDKFARQTYEANFTCEHPIAEDIMTTNIHDIPDHDVLLGGFPCQPFSIAGIGAKNKKGTAHGIGCKRNGNLFLEVLRVISTKRPKAFVLENVKNLLHHNDGKTFKIIKMFLEEVGYELHYRVINAKHFVPQNRERVFIVGFRESTSFDFEAIELPSIDSVPPLKSLLDKNPQNKYTLNDKQWNWLKDYKVAQKKKGNGFGYRLLNKDGICAALITSCAKGGSPLLLEQTNNNPRYLTPNECLQIMGFPKEFIFPVSDSCAYRQAGNAVCPPLTRSIGMHVLNHIQKENYSN